MDLAPGATDVIVWECKSNAKEEESKPEIDARFVEAEKIEASN